MTWIARIALWLHERSLAPAERDAIIGDLIEDFHAIEQTGGPNVAERWIWSQTLGSLAPNIYRRLFTPRMTPAPVTAIQGSVDGGHMFLGLATDLRFAVRLARRQPLMTMVGLLSLTIGLGLNILLFTLADAALLRPLPLRDPSNLVLLMLQRESGLNHNLSYPEYRELRDRATTLDGLVAYSGVEATIAGSDGATTADGEVVSGNLFSTLGVPMRAGRSLGVVDDTPSAPPAIVISEQLWRDRLGAAALSDRSVIVLNTQSFTVVGVTASRFSGMQIGRRAQFWVPLAQAKLLSGEDFLERPTMSWLTVMGRLGATAGVETARQELDATLLRLRQSAGRPHEPVVFRPGARGDSNLSEALDSPLQVLAIAGVLVLLVACFNVANLQLARTDARRFELGMRAALGARRARLVRLVLVDGLLLASVAGAAGIWLALFAKDRAASLIAFYGQPVALTVPLDGRVIAAAAALSLVAALVIGGISAWHSLRGRVMQLAEARSAGSPHRRTQRLLVVVQVALSMGLLTGGALLVRTLDRLRNTELGFDPRGVALLQLSPESGRLSRPASVAYFESAIQTVKALPGVQDAAVSHVMPLDFGGSRMSVEVAGYVPKPDEDMELNFVRITPTYFATLGLPVLQGRAFDDRDRDGQPERIIVNQTMARQFWPDGQAVGKLVRFNSRDPFAVEVVGVVPDTHYRMVREAARPSFYVPLAQWRSDRGALHVRFASGASVRLEELRRVVAAVNPAVPVIRAHTLVDQVERNLADERMATAVGMTLAVAALLLATAGLYATMAFLVGRRTREIGVRMALGARTAEVRSLVLREGVILAIAGVAAGLALSLWVGQVLESRLYGVGAMDLVSFASAALVLTGAAIFASWLPARRASRVDPVIALREY
jgi:putative ABC transport system permease protein